MIQIVKALTRQMKRSCGIALWQIKIIRITNPRRQLIAYNVDWLRNIQVKRLSHLRKPVFNVRRAANWRVVQPINAWKRTEIIIKTMILLDDEDDVLELRC